MTTVVLTSTEQAEVLAHSDVADPVLPPNRIVGSPAAIARWFARIPKWHQDFVQGGTWSRDGGSVPAGGTGYSYERDDATGEVEVEAQHVYRMLDVPGATCSVATRGKLLDAVGERGTRHYSLQYRFSQFGGNDAS